MINLLTRALQDPNLVQSFSGVRTYFGEDDTIDPPREALVAFYGYHYARTLRHTNAPIILARDPRPTGRAVTQALVRGLLAGGCSQFVDLGVITTPLAQSAVRHFKAAGGVIVTASHNPLHDNGWKFLTGSGSLSESSAPEGALLSAEQMRTVVELVNASAHENDLSSAIAVENISPEAAFRALVKSGSRRVHSMAAEAYRNTIVNNWGLDVSDLLNRPLGPALLDPNGGAASGVNSSILENLGVQVYETNAELGRPSHPIDTDSINEETGEHILTRVARDVANIGAVFGVAFDYDADRGNVVLPGDVSECVVPPQTISALNVALSLARWNALGRNRGNTYIVVSDATSRRIEHIAGLFNAKVACVETGEVNVVSCMRELSLQGAEVPIGVEGPNGGSIFAGSTCRDGVLTALSCALAASGEEAADIWLKKSGRMDEASQKAMLDRLIAVLPEWHTPSEKVQAKPLPHAQVKSIMEEVFVHQMWPEIQERYSGYRFTNFEGLRQVNDRTGDHSGGWRIEFERPGANPFIFARGSRTEAGVWRIVADSPDRDEADELLRIAHQLMSSVGQEAAASC